MDVRVIFVEFMWFGVVLGMGSIKCYDFREIVGFFILTLVL